MARFIARRIATAVLVLAVASVAVFTLVTLAPGDPAQIVAERRSFGADREMVERVRAELGLDRPLPVRYLDWLGDVVRGDLGTSLRTNGEIWAELRERTPTTILLVVGRDAVRADRRRGRRRARRAVPERAARPAVAARRRWPPSRSRASTSARCSCCCSP